MLSLGLGIGTISVMITEDQRGIPVPYVTESGANYVAEDGTTEYTTEG